MVGKKNQGCEKPSKIYTQNKHLEDDVSFSYCRFSQSEFQLFQYCDIGFLFASSREYTIPAFNYTYAYTTWLPDMLAARLLEINMV